MATGARPAGPGPGAVPAPAVPLQQGSSGTARPGVPPPSRARPAGTGSTSVTSAADTGAGVLLGILFWGWVALPFLTGGPSKVKAVLMAKFLNKASDGSWLP